MLEDIKSRICECNQREEYLAGREKQLNILLAEIMDSRHELEQLLKNKEKIEELEQRMDSLKKNNEVLKKENEKLSEDRTVLLNRLLRR